LPQKQQIRTENPTLMARMLGILKGKKYRLELSRPTPEPLLFVFFAVFFDPRHIREIRVRLFSSKVKGGR
jgi:hypothetical protein